jgi:hypothetical protein
MRQPAIQRTAPTRHNANGLEKMILKPLTIDRA